MKIRKILIRNFLSHISTDVSFDDGLNLIVGDNGSGKTAMLESVGVALFGGNWTGKRAPVNDVIAYGKDEAKIEVELYGDSKVVKVSRELRKKGGGKTYLYVDSRLVATGYEQVTERLKTELGINELLFNEVVFARQGQLEKLLNLKPHQRDEILLKLTGMEEFEKICNLINEFVREKKGSIEERLKSLRNDVKELECERKKLKKGEEKLSEDEKKILLEITELEMEVSRLGAEIEKFEKDRKRKIEANAKIEAGKKRISEIEREISRLRKIISESWDLRERLTKARELSSFKGYVKKISEIGRERESLKDEVRRLVNDVERLRKLKDEAVGVRDEIDTLRKRKSEVDRKMNEISRRLMELSEAKGEVEMKKRRLAKLKREIADERNHIEKMRKRAENIVSELFWISVDKEALEKYLAKLRIVALDAEKHLSVLREKVRMEEDKLRKLEDAKDKCPVCGGELMETKRRSLIEESLGNLAKLKKIIAESENRIQEYKADTERCEKALKIFVDILPRIEVLPQKEDEVEKLESDIQSFPSDEFKRILVEHEKVSVEIEETERRLNKLEIEERKAERARGEIESIKLRWRGEPEKRLTELKKELERREDEIVRLANQMHEALRQILRNEGIEALLEKIEKAEAEVQAINERLRTIEESEKRLGELKEEMEAVKSELKELESITFDEKAYESVRRKLEAVRSLLVEKHRELGSIEGELRSTKEKLTKVEQEAEQKKNLLSDVEEKFKKLNTLERLRKEVFHREGFPKVIRTRFLDSLAKRVSFYFSEFGLGFDDVFVEGDKEVDFILSREGQRVSWERLSGGEKTCLAIALRFALLDALPAVGLCQPQDMLILDEPTAHLDRTRRAEIVDIISDFLRMRSAKPQIILVSHDEEIINKATGKVIELRKVSGYSKIL